MINDNKNNANINILKFCSDIQSKIERYKKMEQYIIDAAFDSDDGITST